VRRIALLIPAILSFALAAKGQLCNSASIGTTCEDSIRSKDKYHAICEGYQPVCGCDGKTYRNSDAAYWWGAINQWYDGPCEEFDIDLYPNLVTEQSSGLGHLRIYMRNPGTASLVIYNAFGRLMFQRLFSTSLSNAIIPDADPFELYEAQTFPRGVYVLVVVVNGRQKAIKFLKVQE
jgi:hypothetical protein